LLTTLVIASPTAALSEGQTVCDRSKVAALIGRPFSPELAEEARRASGARFVRAVGPGMISSADRLSNRLNVEIDQSRIVTGFWCE
jgi:hypothetical protein